jgi:hypothetical protein
LVAHADLLPQALYQHPWNNGCSSWRCFPITLPRLHLRMPTPRNGELVAHAELLPQALYQHSWNNGCCSWRCLPLPYTYSSY